MSSKWEQSFSELELISHMPPFFYDLSHIGYQKDIYNFRILDIRGVY